MEGMNLRLLAALVAASLVGLVFAATASADSVLQSNEAVTISAKLMNGSNGAYATNGDLLTASLGVKNNLAASQWVHVYLTGDWPYGAFPGYDFLREMKPLESWKAQFWLPVFRFMPRGAYHLGLIVVTPDLIDPLVAQAGITIR
jgi:hypothetical protein